MNDIQWWVWLIIALVIVALVAGAVAASRAASRRRAEEKGRQDEQNRLESSALRDDARSTKADTTRLEAEALTARADAEEARITAERLDDLTQEKMHAADSTRTEIDTRLQEADRIDPDVQVDADNTGEPDTRGSAGRHV